MRINAILIFLFGTVVCSAQTPRQISTRYLAWAGFYGQYNFSQAWNVNLDTQVRYEYTHGDLFTWFFRPGLTWTSKNNILLTAGIGSFKLYANPNSAPPRPEWRLWQEIGKKIIKNKHTIYPRFRFEQRFIRQYGIPVFEENYSFSAYRTRLRCDYTYNITPSNARGSLLLAGNEYMINTNTKGKFSFDQNRAWAGIGYRLNKSTSLQLTYLHLFLRTGSNRFEQHHTARLTLVTQFSKSEKPKSLNESGGS